MPRYDYATSGFVMKDVGRALSKCGDLLTAMPRLLLEAGARATPEMLLQAHPVVLKALKPLLKGGRRTVSKDIPYTKRQVITLNFFHLKKKCKSNAEADWTWAAV